MDVLMPCKCGVPLLPAHHLLIKSPDYPHCSLQQEEARGREVCKGKGGGKGKALQLDVMQALFVHASDASEGGATLRTRVYDDLGKVPWPQDVDGRALRNRFAATFPDGVPEAVGPAAPCSHAACIPEYAQLTARCGACLIMQCKQKKNPACRQRAVQRHGFLHAVLKHGIQVVSVHKQKRRAMRMELKAAFERRAMSVLQAL